jgi:hypothetical protein
MKTSSLKHKDSDVFWLHVEVEFVVFSLSFELMCMHETFSNLQTYLSSAWNTFSVVISNIFGKNRNSNVTFQTGHLTELAKTIDALGCFDLKMFRNCPIRIEIVTCIYFLSESPKKKKKNERNSKHSILIRLTGYLYVNIVQSILSIRPTLLGSHLY